MGTTGSRAALAGPPGTALAAPGLAEDERARVTGLAARSVAAETARAYRSDWGCWEAWRPAGGAAARPADPALAALYVTDHAALVRQDGKPAYAAATLGRRVAPLSAVSRGRSRPASAATARRRGSGSASGTR